MNHDKIGEPYDYPDSFIQLLGYRRAYIFTYYKDKHRVLL